MIIIIATSVSSYRPSLFTFLGKSCTLGPLTCVEKGNMQWYVRDKKNNVMTVYQMMFVLLNSNTTGVISGTGTDNPSGAPEFTVVFSKILLRHTLIKKYFWHFCWHPIFFFFFFNITDFI
jgi:hypothetical protein